MMDKVEKLAGNTYYLVLTTENKWGIALWEHDKWWSDENQDGKLKFGIKDEWIKEYYNLPIGRLKTNKNENSKN